jgi:hypothetical protein
MTQSVRKSNTLIRINNLQRLLMTDLQQYKRYGIDFNELN